MWVIGWHQSSADLLRGRNGGPRRVGLDGSSQHRPKLKKLALSFRANGGVKSVAIPGDGFAGQVTKRRRFDVTITKCGRNKWQQHQNAAANLVLCP